MARWLLAALGITALLFCGGQPRAGTFGGDAEALAVLRVARNEQQNSAYKPPLRGAPEGRVSGATREIAGRRVALVIGNGAYQHLAPLDNPVADARLMAETLQSVGFQVVGGGAQTNLDRAGFEKAVREFGRALQGGAVGLFYYAGHGLQWRGGNYLVPTGANPESSSDVDFDLVNAQVVLDQMEASGAKLNIVLLDACRNNPFGGRGLRAAGGGLAEMSTPRGTLISYAAKSGQVALDGSGGHSPYTAALANVIRRPGLPILEVFNQVAVEVDKATGGHQEPWTAHSPLEGNFYFLGPTTVNITPPAPATPSPDAEIVFWQSIESSKTVADFEEYLRKYPNGQFAGLAGNRLASLRPPPAVNSSQSTTNDQLASPTAGAIERGDTALAQNNYAEALRRYREAADTGSSDALYKIGLMYVSGQARHANNRVQGEENNAEALRWFRKAAANGNSSAMTYIGMMSVPGDHSLRPPAPESEAFGWFNKAASLGNGEAMMHLGEIYSGALGSGPPHFPRKDLGKAFYWAFIYFTTTSPVPNNRVPSTSCGL